MSDTEDTQTFIGRIYEIVNDVDDEFYIGSTKDRLSRRMYGHRGKVKQGRTSTIYSKMRELGTDQFRIVLIEEIECASIDELRRCEQKHIRERRPTLNKLCAAIDDERREEIKKEAKEYDRKKYVKGRTKIIERVKQHYVDNREERLAYQITLSAKYREAKTFHCEACDHAFKSNNHLQRHFTSQKHKRNTQE